MRPSSTFKFIALLGPFVMSPSWYQNVSFVDVVRIMEKKWWKNVCFSSGNSKKILAEFWCKRSTRSEPKKEIFLINFASRNKSKDFRIKYLRNERQIAVIRERWWINSFLIPPTSTPPDVRRMWSENEWKIFSSSNTSSYTIAYASR